MYILFKYPITSTLSFSPSGFNPEKHTQTIQIRDGTIYQEVIGVRRWWEQPWRKTTCHSSTPYYDLTIMELGKIIDRKRG
jgi:hypothetical protein